MIGTPIYGEVQEDLGQLLLGPALAQGEAEVKGEFGLAPGAGVGHDAE